MVLTLSGPHPQKQDNLATSLRRNVLIYGSHPKNVFNLFDSVRRNALSSHLQDLVELLDTVRRDAQNSWISGAEHFHLPGGHAILEEHRVRHNLDTRQTHSLHA